MVPAGGVRRERAGPGKDVQCKGLVGPGPGISSLQDGTETHFHQKGRMGGDSTGEARVGLICG